MTIETLKSLNSRNRNGISVIKSNILSVSSMYTFLAILKVTDARLDVILAGGLYHRFPWSHLPPTPWWNVIHSSFLPFVIICLCHFLHFKFLSYPYLNRFCFHILLVITWPYARPSAPQGNLSLSWSWDHKIHEIYHKGIVLV